MGDSDPERNGEQEGQRRSWIVASCMEDGRERRDVLNAASAEEAARMAASAGAGKVVRVEARKRPGDDLRRQTG